MSKFQGKLARAVLLEDFSYLVSMGESVHSHLFDKRLPRGALCILPRHHADAYTLTEHLHLPEGDVLLSFFINFFQDPTRMDNFWPQSHVFLSAPYLTLRAVQDTHLTARMHPVDVSTC